MGNELKYFDRSNTENGKDWEGSDSLNVKNWLQLQDKDSSQFVSVFANDSHSMRIEFA